MHSCFRRQHLPRHEPGSRRGAMLALIAVSLFVILAFLALSVDLAYMQLSRSELRVATDAAARAAVESLSREQSVSKAITAARQIAEANEVAGQPLILGDQDIILGRMAFQTGTKWEFFPNEEPYNAIRILGRRTAGSRSGPINLFFGGVSGDRQFETQISSTAANLDRDVALVIDHSGSMLWYNRWKGLQQAVDIFLRELDRSDPIEHVSLAGYSSEARLYQPLTGDTSLIRAALSGLSPAGQTNIGGGLQAGSDSLEDPAYRRAFAAKVVVLMTDGNHNTGTDPLLVASQLAGTRSHKVHTVTFGQSANQSLMRRVAEATGGTFYHAADNNELVQIYREIALTLPVLLVD